MRNRTQIERKAWTLLCQLGVTKAPVEVFEVARSLGVRVQMEWADDEVSGALYRDDGNGAIIGVNGRHHPNRQRFTVAHEIGHLVLHDEPVFVDHVFRRDQVSSEAVDPLEIEANGFAAALLMPKEFVMHAVQSRKPPLRSDVVERLADDFQVSSQAMTFRLERLGVPLDHV